MLTTLAIAGGTVALLAIGGILDGAGAILIMVGRSQGQLRGQMATMRTSRIDGLMPGYYVEVKGVASCERALQAPGDDRPCVYYSYEVKRRERRRDSDGKTSHHWRTVDQGSNETPFELTDDSGTVTIDPAGAKFDARKVFDQPIDRSSNFGEGMLGTIMSGLQAMGTEPQKMTVHAIEVDQPLYVLGDTTRGPGDSLRIARGDGGKFFISCRSEEQLDRSLGFKSKGFMIGGLLACVGGAVLLVMGVMRVVG